MVFGAEKDFPAHWGEPPEHSDRESAIDLPGGYGYAPPRVGVWVRERMVADGLDPDAPGGAKDEDADDEEGDAPRDADDRVR